MSGATAIRWRSSARAADARACTPSRRVPARIRLEIRVCRVGAQSRRRARSRRPSPSPSRRRPRGRSRPARAGSRAARRSTATESRPCAPRGRGPC
eukprot:6177475-Pleurochrysis_carterae.AAC.11